MYLLFTDETNVSPKYDSRIKFLAYGGLVINSEKLIELDEGISKIRNEAGYSSTDSLKFDTHTKPKGVTPERFAEVKNKVINLCIKLDCKFLVYVVLHKIAENQGLAKTIKWGADHIVGKFNFFLQTKSDKGQVIVDRFSDVSEYNFLSEKFTSGLILKDKTIPLSNIRLYSSSCDNASNFSSAMDIVLGSFRYCINQPFNQESAKTMMINITTLIWANKNGEIIDPFEKGLTFRPRPEDIKVLEYKQEYENLIKHINTLLS